MVDTLMDVVRRLELENLARRRADERLARTVSCPRCRAPRDTPCRTARGRATRMHIGRWLTAQGR